MIDWTKPVETDEKPPRPVRVLCQDCKGYRSQYMCAIDCGEFEVSNLFNSQGHPQSGVTRLRNVQPKPRIVMEKRWVNVHPPGSPYISAVFRSQQEADNSDQHCIACVEIDWPVAVVDELEVEPKVEVEKTCVNCKHEEEDANSYPCTDRTNRYQNQWEPKS